MTSVLPLANSFTGAFSTAVSDGSVASFLYSLNQIVGLAAGPSTQVLVAFILVVSCVFFTTNSVSALPEYSALYPLGTTSFTEYLISVPSGLNFLRLVKVCFQLFPSFKVIVSFSTSSA